MFVIFISYVYLLPFLFALKFDQKRVNQKQVLSIRATYF